MGGISLLEDVLPSSGFLLRLAEGSPGGGDRGFDFRAFLQIPLPREPGGEKQSAFGC